MAQRARAAKWRGQPCHGSLVMIIPFREVHSRLSIPATQFPILVPGRRTASSTSDRHAGLPVLSQPLVCLPAPRSRGAQIGRAAAGVPSLRAACLSRTSERLGSIHVRDALSVVIFRAGVARGGRPASAPPMCYTAEKAPKSSSQHCCVSCLAPHWSYLFWAFNTRGLEASRRPAPPRRLSQWARVTTGGSVRTCGRTCWTTAAGKSRRRRAASSNGPDATHEVGAGASAAAGAHIGDGGGGECRPATRRPADGAVHGVDDSGRGRDNSEAEGQRTGLAGWRPARTGPQQNPCGRAPPTPHSEPSCGDVFLYMIHTKV